MRDELRFWRGTASQIADSAQSIDAYAKNQQKIRKIYIIGGFRRWMERWRMPNFPQGGVLLPLQKSLNPPIGYPRIGAATARFSLENRVRHNVCCVARSNFA